VASLYDLLSQAAAKLGADPVPNLTDDTRDVEVWSAIWQPTLQREIDYAPWPFATVTAELSQLLTPPGDPKYTYAYQLPGDYSVTRAVLDERGNRSSIEFEVQGNLLYSNASRLFLKYGRTYGINDVPSLPSYFTPYLVNALAYEAANALTAEQSDLQRCARDLTITQRQAHVAAGLQNTPQQFGSPGRYRTARWSGR
jgi:hypothetical protein